MFAPAGQTAARAGQLCWLAALVVRRQAPSIGRTQGLPVSCRPGMPGPYTCSTGYLGGVKTPPYGLSFTGAL